MDTVGSRTAGNQRSEAGWTFLLAQNGIRKSSHRARKRDCMCVELQRPINRDRSVRRCVCEQVRQMQVSRYRLRNAPGSCAPQTSFVGHKELARWESTMVAWRQLLCTMFAKATEGSCYSHRPQMVGHTGSMVGVAAYH
eukprot:1155884-Pelagomonas_calceolata.AAC.2